MQACSTASGPKSMTALCVASISRSVERYRSLEGLEEDLVKQIFEEVLRLGKLSPRVLDVFLNTEHNSVLKRISALNIQSPPLVLPTSRNLWLGDKPDWRLSRLGQSRSTAYSSSGHLLFPSSGRKVRCSSALQQMHTQRHSLGLKLLVLAVDKNAVRKRPPALGLSLQSERLRRQLQNRPWPAPQRQQESYDEFPKQGLLEGQRQQYQQAMQHQRKQTVLADVPLLTEEVLSMNINANQLPKEAFEELVDTCGLADSWRAKATLLWHLGLRQTDIRLLVRREYMSMFAVSASTLQRRLRFLHDEGGFDLGQLRALMTRWPPSMSFATKHWRAHMAFFESLGVPPAMMPQVIIKAPQLFAGLSLENTLKPRVQHFLDMTQLPKAALPQVLARGPMIFTVPEESVSERVFLLLDFGFSEADVASIVQRHPMVMAYSQTKLEGILEYLESLGLESEDIVHMITRMPSLLSLNIANNLAPKVSYLNKQLCGHTQMLIANPVYLTLSLQGRIMPRHRFMHHTGVLARAEPMSISPAMLVDDARFAVSIAKSSLEAYEAFRLQLKGRV